MRWSNETMADSPCSPATSAWIIDPILRMRGSTLSTAPLAWMATTQRDGGEAD